MKKHILSLFFGFFILFQGLACDQSTAQVLSIVDNSDGTRTYKIKMKVDIGGMDTRPYLGFLLVFNGLESTPVVKFGNNYNTTKIISQNNLESGMLIDSLTAKVGNDINSLARVDYSKESNYGKGENFDSYKTMPNAISFECINKDDIFYEGAARSDFYVVFYVTIEGCVKSINYYPHMNNNYQFEPCKKSFDVVATKLGSSYSVSSQDSYTWPSSGITYFASGIYKKRFTGNCDLDSTVTLNLTILNKHHSKKDIYLCSGYNYTYKDGTKSINITQDENHVSILKNGANDNQDSIIQEFIFVKQNSYIASKTINVCNGSSYTFPDNTILNNFKNDTTHLVKLVGKAANGCDSTVLYTIYVRPHAYVTKTYEVGLNKYFYFADNKRIDSVLNDTTRISYIKTKYGCDSIVTQNLIVKQSPTISKNSTLCYGEKIYRYNKYLTIVSDTIINYFKNGKYYYSPDTIVVETIKLNKPRTLTEVSDKICALQNYTSTYGFSIYGIKRDTILVKSKGILDTNSCYDSIIKINVKVNPIHSITNSYKICYNGSFTFNDGTIVDSINRYISHVSKYKNIFGCDSVITEQINPNPQYYYKKTRICIGSSYTFLDGTIINNISDTISHQTIFSFANKCDSIVKEFLEVVKPSAVVYSNGVELSVNDWLNTISNFQWYDCNSNMPIIGDTSNKFVIKLPGDYRVEYDTKESCRFSTACYEVKNTGINDLTQKQISIYPNPTTGKIVISSPDNNIKSIRITTIEGKVLDEISAIQSNEFSYELSNSSSVYLVKIETEKGLEIHRVIRE